MLPFGCGLRRARALLEARQNWSATKWERPPRSGRGRGRKKFVAVDASRDAPAAVVRLDPYDLREAADMDIAGHGDFSRQGKNKFDDSSRLKIGVDQKVEAAETDIPRLSLPFDSAIRPACPDGQRKRHCESPRGSAFD
jgi:hypothetical protein